MSSSDDTTRESRDATSPEARWGRGLVRRMAVKLTRNPLWQVLGHLLLDNTREVREAEVFQGIGFYARPADGANAECMVVFPGGAANPVIVATRDEDLRKTVAALDANQTAMFNRSTIVLCHSNGTVEIRMPSGTASKLPTMADFQGIVSILSSSGAGAGTNVPLALSNYQAAHPTWPVGTTVLKAQ